MSADEVLRRRNERIEADAAAGIPQGCWEPEDRGHIPDVSWPGAGQHEGHDVRPIEVWWPRVEDDGVVTCGRVRCSCGAEWSVGGWPLEKFGLFYRPGPVR